MARFVIKILSGLLNLFCLASLWVIVLHNIHVKAEREIARQITYAWIDPEMAVFGPEGCGNPCVVKRSAGGFLVAYRNMMSVIKADGRQLIIDGPCVSACVPMADFARPQTCITPRASFHFHMGTIRPSGVRFAPPTSSDILWWVIANGGFPYEGTLEMKFSEARNFWPVCAQFDKTDRIAQARN